VNHKDIGVLYFQFALVAASYGLGFSMYIRWELIRPGAVLFMGDYQTYNVFVTSHAIMMIFFVVMPTLIGSFGNILVPLHQGVSDMSFPRVNQLAFLTLIPSMYFLVKSTSTEGGAGTGWTFYPPLSVSGHQGPAVDLGIVSFHVSGISSMSGAVNFVVTFRYMKAHKMKMHTRTLYV
jgi:heme/copper-type cytochrome/quinol oxidase subunit 1